MIKKCRHGLFYLIHGLGVGFAHNFDRISQRDDLFLSRSICTSKGYALVQKRACLIGNTGKRAFHLFNSVCTLLYNLIQVFRLLKYIFSQVAKLAMQGILFCVQAVILISHCSNDFFDLINTLRTVLDETVNFSTHICHS